MVHKSSTFQITKFVVKKKNLSASNSLTQDKRIRQTKPKRIIFSILHPTFHLTSYCCYCCFKKFPKETTKRSYSSLYLYLRTEEQQNILEGGQTSSKYYIHI